MARKEVNDTSGILTPEQKDFLKVVAQENYFCSRFYFTGGTPLAAFYLQHRLSEDIDLFSEEEIYLPSISSFVKKVQKKLGIERVDYNNFLGLHSFQLYFSVHNILKVDFNYYPFPRIEKGIKYQNISVDSILDIAVNKIHTIAMKPRARDFIDIYFILKQEHYVWRDLLLQAKAKFDWHIDPVLLGSRLRQAAETSDYPRMIKPVNHDEWKNFFLQEAKKLRKDIFV